MINMQEFIAKSPFAKKIEVDELLFAEFKCPLDQTKSEVWWHNNFFTHVLTGETTLKTPRGEYTLRAGDSAFAKKGSVIARNDLHEDFCELLVFVPDVFIRTVAQKYELPLAGTGNSTGDTIIPLATSDVLHSYFQSLLSYFVQREPPSGTLLKLKFEELLLNIAAGYNQALEGYFSEICKTARPSIKGIMEANFFSNLTLDEFARLCTRSVSAFKKEFTDVYHTTPGKWLLEKRLEYSMFLLETTDYMLDEICMESGFENLSHFIRVFKNKYGVPPGKFKAGKSADSRKILAVTSKQSF